MSEHDSIGIALDLAHATMMVHKLDVPAIQVITRVVVTTD
jgi:hypothetical protein